MSDYFTWIPEKYELQVPDMDREHQILIGHMNQLHDLYSRHAPRNQLALALDGLARYTVKHFQDEEAYMARTHYRDLASHKQIHANLLRKVGAHVSAFQASGTLNEEFFSFLRMWLKAHICGIDSQYARPQPALAGEAQ